MKTIGIVINESLSLGEMLKANLLRVFEGFVEINIHRLQYMKEDYKIEDDVVLVMMKEKAIEIFKYIAQKEKVVVIERTISLEAFLNLRTIPSGARVLVVNDNYTTTVEFTTYLSMILKDVQLEPYRARMDVNEFKIMITPNEEACCPHKIESVFNTGHRVIDSATFIQIMSVLNINDTLINSRLLEYFNTIVSINNGINDKFVEIVDKGIILEALLDNTADGILILDTQKNIKLHNQRIKNFLNIKEDIHCKSWNKLIKKYFSDDEIIKKIKSDEEFKDEIFIIGERYFKISKSNIIEFGKNSGYLITVTEITYIKKIEQNLSGKLLQQGHVARYSFEDIYTKSLNLKNVIKLAEKAAKSDYSVMIQGESGTGKELFAQAIHNYSDRKNQPFLAINCAAVPEHLLESELFGYVGGSFTGALKEGKKGLFENANNGTIFLDEIGDMPLNLQSKLLRVIQEKQISRLGSHEVINIDVRLIAATHKNLMHHIEKGDFRADLYYRLNVIPIELPSLSERKEDIVDLMKLFVEKELEIGDKLEWMLENYPWNGNVRELQNAAKYIRMMIGNENVLKEEHLPNYIKTYFEKNKTALAEEDKNIEVLKAIKALADIGKSAGRGSISKYLSNKNLSISEGEIRSILEKLKELKLIEIEDRRLGAKLTSVGLEKLGKYSTYN